MREATKSRTALLIGSREVHGHPGTLEDLTSVLATVPRGLAIAITCYVGSHWNGDRASDWMKLDLETFQPFLLSPGTRDALRLYSASQDAPTVVFTRRRALTLLRLSYLLCPDSDARNIGDDEQRKYRYAIGEAFLHVGDLQEIRAEKELEDVISLMLPAFEESNRPTMMLAYTRVYKMVRDPLWDSAPILIEAARRFSERTGLSIRSYMYVIAGLLAKLLNRQEQENHGMVKLTDVFARARDGEAIRMAINSLAIRASDVPMEVGHDLDRIVRDRSQEPFRSHPLIDFQRDDVFGCPDIYGLGEQLSSGLYWKIFRMFTTKEEPNTFSGAWAKLFENPIAARLELAIKKGRSGLGPHPRLFRNPVTRTVTS